MEIEPKQPTGQGLPDRFTGFVQARDGDPWTVNPGEAVCTPPGEWHWHGATETDFMEHLALSEDLPPDARPTVTWGEHVTDIEYRNAQQISERNHQ